MTKKSTQTSMYLTQATKQQADYLKVKGYGSFTDIVRIAIDRMYNLELERNNDKKTK